MFGLSLGEIILTGTIALIFLGPEKMITLIISAGRLLGKVRSTFQEIKGEVGKAGVVRELEKIGNKTVLDQGSYTPGPSIFSPKSTGSPQGGWTCLSSDTQRIMALEKELAELKNRLGKVSERERTVRTKAKGVNVYGNRRKTRK